MSYNKLIGLCGLALSACGGVGAGEPVERGSSQVEALAGSTAAGVVPTGLPARVQVGLFEDSGGTWMRSSGVKWDTRYRYFTKGWVNNWGWAPANGSWGLDYLQESDQQGYLPAVQYYQLFSESGGGEAQTLQKVQTPSVMLSYFSDFKILMQRVKEFGKPALILIEADGVGFLEQQTHGNPNTYAAVAASGLPELAGLPNTVAGFGLAYLQLKQAVGASNAVLGLHVSGWASGKDVAAYNVTDALQPEVDEVYDFLSPLGLTNNVTGAQYDVLVGDPLDRDADYYRLVQGSDRTWDASDSASINSRSFNRYAEWLRLWNVKAEKRWVLWQIPLGNSAHKNVYNNGNPAEGYRDNRAEYFLGSGPAHIEKFAASGVIALLFGAGTSGQSSYQNDVYSDGQLFMRSRAAGILNAGGVPIGTGGIATPTPPPTTTGTSAPPPAPTCSPATGGGTGLLGEYFTGTSLSPTGLALARTDATVDFSWGSDAPAAALPADHFSARWTGQVSPRFSGATTFFTVSDDGVRLWVNGQLLIDNWTDHGQTENSATISLVAGQKYDLELEYYEAAGGAIARLLWSGPCETKQVVPSSQLYPASNGVGDAARYHFEGSTQSWSPSGSASAVSAATERAFAGTYSLKVNLSGPGDAFARLASPAVPAGATVSFHIWVPADSTLSAVQPYVVQGAGGGWAWTGNYQTAASLQLGNWNTLTVQVPANASDLYELGVQFVPNGSVTTAAYVDSVTW